MIGKDTEYTYLCLANHCGPTRSREASAQVDEEADGVKVDDLDDVGCSGSFAGILNAENDGFNVYEGTDQQFEATEPMYDIPEEEWDHSSAPFDRHNASALGLDNAEAQVGKMGVFDAESVFEDVWTNGTTWASGASHPSRVDDRRDEDGHGSDAAGQSSSMSDLSLVTDDDSGSGSEIYDVYDTTNHFFEDEDLPEPTTGLEAADTLNIEFQQRLIFDGTLCTIISMI